MNNVFEEKNKIIKKAIENHVTTSNEKEILVDDKDLQIILIPCLMILYLQLMHFSIKIDEKIEYGFEFSGNNILNNVGSAFSKK